MSKSNAAQYHIEKIKKQAKRLAKSESLKITESLDIIAKQQGYPSWHAFQISLKNGDTGTSPVRAIKQRQQLYQSRINYAGEHFCSPNSFRNRFEREIKDVLRRATGCVKIEIYLFIDQNTVDLLEGSNDIFDQILERYEKIDYLHVKIVEEDYNNADILFQLIGNDEEEEK